MACNLRRAGRPLEAKEAMRKHMDQQLRVWSPEFVVILAEDYGALLADLKEFQQAARLLGAADAARERRGTPRSPRRQTDIEGAFSTARRVLGPEVWLHEYRLGCNETVEEALTHAESSDSKQVATGT
jgi:hypothetical protein